jgi:hypothetical protein
MAISGKHSLPTEPKSREDKRAWVYTVIYLKMTLQTFNENEKKSTHHLK